jgi:hypothetical protein
MITPERHANRQVPNAVLMVAWQLTELEKVANDILDSYSDPVDRAYYLGLLRAQSDRLRDTVSAIESIVARDDWGTGSRGAKRNKLTAPDLMITRALTRKYIWDTKPVLFEALKHALTNQGTGEVPSDEVVWDVVNAVLRYGTYDPRVTSLYEDGLYDQESIQDVRKAEEGRMTVKIEEVASNDAATEARGSE